ncbi:hypothetical protein MY3296_000788 [Beauveria thailandica]
MRHQQPSDKLPLIPLHDAFTSPVRLFNYFAPRVDIGPSEIGISQTSTKTWNVQKNGR